MLNEKRSPLKRISCMRRGGGREEGEGGVGRGGGRGEGEGEEREGEREERGGRG